jgi:acyl dehydratase
MTLDMAACGRKIGPLIRNYDWKDVILYALSVGAGFDEFSYVYEKNLKVIPSFSVAAIFDFFWAVASSAGVSPEGVLHGEQEILFYEPVPAEGILTTEGTITDYFDKGSKGALIRAESSTRHSDGKILYKNIMTLFSRRDGGFGGAPGVIRSFSFPERHPDYVVDARTSPSQPLLYRLTGDFFPLHADPEFAAKAGFAKPIMHGMCTFGFACRALIGSLIPGKPEMTKHISCRFAQPLYPGEPIRTLIWKDEENRALWCVVHGISGRVIIDRGIFAYGDRLT